MFTTPPLDVLLLALLSDTPIYGFGEEKDSTGASVRPAEVSCPLFAGSPGASPSRGHGSYLLPARFSARFELLFFRPLCLNVFPLPFILGPA